MHESKYDYGRDAIIGVATPQANPTVEAEFSLLFPRSVSMQATRLACADPDPYTRLTSYIENFEQTLTSYAGMPLDAVGFACTGSSYLVGKDTEQKIVDDILERTGYKVVTATAAIKAALDARSINKIALVAPYPQRLIDTGKAYWEELGIEITALSRVITTTTDTRSIYELSSADATKALANLDIKDAQAVLLSGTGMPTLPCIANAETAVPVLSSNLCLAWQLLSITGLSQHLAKVAPEITGWRSRLAEI